MSLKRRFALTWFVVVGALSAAPITISVFPSLGPNPSGSPSFPGYRTNALADLQNGVASTGNPATDPTAYFQVSQLGFHDAIVSATPSFRGIADPGTAFGPAFANELGNEAFFAVDIKGNGTQFSVSELQGALIASNPPGNPLNLPTPPGMIALNFYSPNRVGIIYGPGGTRTFVTSGPATQLVDELVSVGLGNALSTSGGSGSTPQQVLDSVAAQYAALAPFTLTGTYSLVDPQGVTLATGSNGILFGAAAVPEPGTLGLLALGAGLFLLKRLR